VENYLLDYFREIPTLTLELKVIRFEFQDTNQQKGQVDSLRKRLVTKPIAVDDVDSLKSHFQNNKGLADEFKRTVDLVVSFVSRTLAAASAGDEEGGSADSNADADAQDQSGMFLDFTKYM
jgi:hypothetical protein